MLQSSGLLSTMAEEIIIRWRRPMFRICTTVMIDWSIDLWPIPVQTQYFGLELTASSTFASARQLFHRRPLVSGSLSDTIRGILPPSQKLVPLPALYSSLPFASGYRWRFSNSTYATLVWRDAQLWANVAWPYGNIEMHFISRPDDRPTLNDG